MKLTTILTLTLSFILFNSHSNGQTWQQMMDDPNANFYEIQEAFNSEWADKDYEKGKGWKQYKRWEYFWESRIDEHGNFPSSSQIHKSINQKTTLVKKHKNSNHSVSGPWTPLGPFNLSNGQGRINVIEVDPTNPDVIYIGAPSGGLWKTTDAGNSWTPMTDHLPTVSVSGVAVNPENPDVVLIMTGDFNHWAAYGTGVWRSEDGGNTWSPTGLNYSVYPNYRRGGKISYMPGDTTVVISNTHDGLYRSEDGGFTWDRIINDDVEDFEFHPTNNQIIYTVSGSTGYRSTNGGEFFQVIDQDFGESGQVSRMQIAVTPANPDVVYYLGGGDITACWKSSDQGQSFSQQHDNNTGNPMTSQVWYDMAFDVSPSDEDLLFIGGVSMFKSTNAGLSFPVNITNGVHVDIQWLRFFGEILYAGTDGGIYRSFNDGQSWENLSLGIQITQYYDFSNSNLNLNLISAGSQDNGTHKRNNNGSWSRYSGGDGLQTEIDYSNPDVIYHSYQRGNMRKTVNGGVNAFSIFTHSFDVEGESNWETPIIIDPNNPNIVYCGRKQLWKSETGGDNEFVVSNFNGGNNIDEISIAKSDSDIIAVIINSNVYLTEDGGNSWNDISNPLPNSNISSLEFHPEDPDRMWVSFSSYSPETNVYYSEDRGVSWTNISGSLPDSPCHQVIYQAGHPDNCLYVATEVGVFYTDDTYTDWIPFMEGLPNCYIADIEIIPGTNTIRVASYGRGVWENQVIKSTDYPATADFYSSSLETCPYVDIPFINVSQNYDDIVEWYFEGGTPEFSTDENPTIYYESEGTYDVRLIVSDSNTIDTFLREDYITISLNEQVDLDIVEGFPTQNLPELWDITNDDQAMTWSWNGGVGGFNLDLGSMWINNYAYNTSGSKDYLELPSVNLSETENPSLSFDLAYTYYQSGGSIFIDSLAIYYSKDCGVTLFKLWQEGGDDLSTTPPIAGSFVPSSDQWETIIINLNDLKDESEIQFYFVGINYYGNNLYIDNINLVSGLALVDNDMDGFTNDVDCDDSNPDINPDATETVYNGIDDDCNPETLDDDLDQDGFVLAEDCNDDNADINPGQVEVPYNGIDEDCNEATLDDDLDQDGFILAEDCDDNNENIFPGNDEIIYNGIDDDCDESTLDDDLDQDGFVLADDCDDNNADVNPDAIEIPGNGIDEDCDGMDGTSSIINIGDLNISYFPNPVKDNLNINLSNSTKLKIDIIDISGKIVQSLAVTESTLINVSNLASGAYILRFEKDGQQISRRIAKD